jgi:predicted glycosyltransferase
MHRERLLLRKKGRPYRGEENDESIGSKNYYKNTQIRNKKKMNMTERERLMKEKISCICLNVNFKIMLW